MATLAINKFRHLVRAKRSIGLPPLIVHGNTDGVNRLSALRPVLILTEDGLRKHGVHSLGIVDDLRNPKIDC